MSGYLLDANAIIAPFHEPKLRALALSYNTSLEETREALENWLEDGVLSGKLLIADEVQREVLAKEGRPGYDVLKKLAGRYEPLYPSEEEFNLVREVQAFVEKHFPLHQAHAFAKGADPFLVAFAKARGLTIITEERQSVPQVDGKTGRIEGKVTLTYVAFAFGVRCLPLMSALVEIPLRTRTP